MEEVMSNESEWSQMLQDAGVVKTRPRISERDGIYMISAIAGAMILASIAVFLILNRQRIERALPILIEPLAIQTETTPVINMTAEVQVSRQPVYRAVLVAAKRAVHGKNRKALRAFTVDVGQSAYIENAPPPGTKCREMRSALGAAFAGSICTTPQGVSWILDPADINWTAGPGPQDIKMRTVAGDVVGKAPFKKERPRKLSKAGSRRAPGKATMVLSARREVSE